MEKQAVIRRIRIAMSVIFGVLVLTSCVLGVRSYWWIHTATIRMDPGVLAIQSSAGKISVERNYSHSPTTIFHHWAVEVPPGYYELEPATFGFEFVRAQHGEFVHVALPYWALVTVSAVLLLISFIGTRFSLRTMFIVTTLSAVLLGLGVWLAR